MPLKQSFTLRGPEKYCTASFHPISDQQKSRYAASLGIPPDIPLSGNAFDQPGVFCDVRHYHVEPILTHAGFDYPAGTLIIPPLTIDLPSSFERGTMDIRNIEREDGAVPGHFQTTLQFDSDPEVTLRYSSPFNKMESSLYFLIYQTIMIAMLPRDFIRQMQSDNPYIIMMFTENHDKGYMPHYGGSVLLQSIKREGVIEFTNMHGELALEADPHDFYDFYRVKVANSSGVYFIVN